MAVKAKKIISLGIIIVLAIALQAQTAFAIGLLGPGVNKSIDDETKNVAGPNYSPSTDENSLVEMVSVVVGMFLGLLATIFIILIIIAGYNWLTAGGNEEKVGKARSIMSRAIIGLIVTTAAYAITWFIFARLPDNLNRPY